jgi:uncharacterized protein YndB with AHSA1/START domain
MTDVAVKPSLLTPEATAPNTHAIVVDEVLPHAPERIWKALTTGALIARWLMEPSGFEPVEGKHFTYKTSAAGAWDGTIRCQVLEVRPNERLSYAWQGGDESNVGYGARLETVVTFTLTPVPTGTRLRLVHSGFVLPKNETAYRNMSGGWVKCVEKLDAMAGERA